MFKKIKSINTIPDWNELKGEYRYGEPPAWGMFSIKNLVYLEKFFAPILEFKVYPVDITYLEICTSLYIHTDGASNSYRACCNFILESGAATTKFYKKNETNLNDVSLPHTSVYGVKVPNSNDFSEIASFTSESGDFYLIDVTKWHSVEMPTNKIRRLISFRWSSISIETAEKCIVFKN